MLFFADCLIKNHYPPCAPFQFIYSFANITVKARILPILWILGQTMLYGVVVDVVEMVLVIIFITNGVFPKPALPNTDFASFIHRLRGFRCYGTHPTFVFFAKMGLYVWGRPLNYNFQASRSRLLVFRYGVVRSSPTQSF